METLLGMEAERRGETTSLEHVARKDCDGNVTTTVDGRACRYIRGIIDGAVLYATFNKTTDARSELYDVEEICRAEIGGTMNVAVVCLPPHVLLE
jgi:hypothetical protein